MKRAPEIIVLCLLFLGLVSASIEVNNLTFDKYYIPFIPFGGEINLSIMGEDFTQDVKSSEGEVISLEDFLEANFADYSCTPSDCSMNYGVVEENVDGIFNIEHDGGKRNLGFVIYGDNPILNLYEGIFNFTISSDFIRETERPLTIDFFEGGYLYEFNEVSSEFSQKNWGCYDNATAELGPPIIGSVYCEKIFIVDTGGIFVGAIVDNSSGAQSSLFMEVHSDEGLIEGSCDYNPSVDSGCLVYGEPSFSQGFYDICVGSDGTTPYHKIYRETSGESCGYIYGEGSSANSTKDYSIFAQTAKFADADLLDIGPEITSETFDSAQKIILEKYGGDCTNGCILPIEIEGVSQNFNIGDIQIGYKEESEGDDVSTKVYNLESIPAMVDFEGILDLSLLNFYVSEDGSYSISIGNSEIFEEDLEKTDSPIITSLSPINPPAGVPIPFYVGVDFSSNRTLTYKWDFGDNSTAETNVNFVEHIYENLTSYIVTVEASAGFNLTGKREFIINTISPSESIDIRIIQLMTALNRTRDQLRNLTTWYGEAIEKIVDVDYYISEVNNWKSKKENTFGDEKKLIDIAKNVFSLDVPEGIIIESSIRPSFFTELEDINLQPVVNIAGGSVDEDLKLYREPVLRWQSKNILVNVSTKEFLIGKGSGNVEGIFRTYDIDLLSNADEDSYLIINKPFEEIYFRGDSGAKKSGDVTYLILKPGEELSLEFYYSTSSEETSFFVSPKLSSIVIEELIDESCNSNFICEDGENYKNCRSDCKPVFLSFVYITLALLIVLIVYTLLQIWYKVHYENYLFGGDRKQLFNILMYINNARARNIGDDKISRELKKQGWSGERVNYVMKKSRGGRTGLYEIIPVERVMNYFRSLSAKKKIVTNTGQQSGRNINKYAFRRSSGVKK